MSNDFTSDERLLRLFLSGDRNACRRVESWARELVRFRGYGFSAEDREDTVQQALADVWRTVSRAEFALKTSLPALIRTIAAARCIDHLRRRRPTTDVPDHLADPTPSPYDDLLRGESDAQLRWALQNSSDACREIIRRHFFEGQRYREIADSLGRAEATLRVRMFHCVKRLRSLLARFESA